MMLYKFNTGAPAVNMEGVGRRVVKFKALFLFLRQTG